MRETCVVSLFPNDLDSRHSLKSHHFDNFETEQGLAIVPQLLAVQRVRRAILLNRLDFRAGQAAGFGARRALDLLLAFLLLVLERSFVLETGYGAHGNHVLSNTPRTEEVRLCQSANPGLLVEIQRHPAVVRYLHPTLGKNVEMIVSNFYEDKKPT